MRADPEATHHTGVGFIEVYSNPSNNPSSHHIRRQWDLLEKACSILVARSTRRALRTTTAGSTHARNIHSVLITLPPA